MPEDPPRTWREIMRIVGPGVVWAAAAIGSGELIITAKAGATYGLSFVWALWIGLWLKYWIQKGILDLTILTGKPILQLWHQEKYGKFSSIFWLLFFVLNDIGVAGLLGLSASILHLIFPDIGISVWAILVTLSIVALAYGQRYASFEKMMMIFAGMLGIGTILTAALAAPAPHELIAWALPSGSAATLLFLSLLGWGAGSGPDLMIPYSTWVAEKGYQKLPAQKMNVSAAQNENPPAISHIAAWLSAIKWDLILGYIATGIVASVFMIAGAKVLQPLGIAVDGVDVIRNLSTIFTASFGQWSFYLFLIAAFAAIYDTALGVFDGGRLSSGQLVRMLLKKEPVPIEEIRRNVWYRVALVVLALVPLIIFLGVQQPVMLVVIASIISAIAMPLLGMQVLLSLRHLPHHFRPGRFYAANLLLGIVVYIFFMGGTLYQLLV